MVAQKSLLFIDLTVWGDSTTVKEEHGAQNDCLFGSLYFISSPRGCFSCLFPIDSLYVRKGEGKYSNFLLPFLLKFYLNVKKLYFFNIHN